MGNITPFTEFKNRAYKRRQDEINIELERKLAAAASERFPHIAIALAFWEAKRAAYKAGIEYEGQLEAFKVMANSGDSYDEVYHMLGQDIADEYDQFLQWSDNANS